jgi:hypothetical protein
MNNIKGMEQIRTQLGHQHKTKSVHIIAVANKLTLNVSTKQR